MSLGMDSRYTESFQAAVPARAVRWVDGYETICSNENQGNQMISSWRQSTATKTSQKRKDTHVDGDVLMAHMSVHDTGWTEQRDAAEELAAELKRCLYTWNIAWEKGTDMSRQWSTNTMRQSARNAKQKRCQQVSILWHRYRLHRSQHLPCHLMVRSGSAVTVANQIGSTWMQSGISEMCERNSCSGCEVKKKNVKQVPRTVPPSTVPVIVEDVSRSNFLQCDVFDPSEWRQEFYIYKMKGCNLGETIC